jgi:hypothetical protein
MQSTTEKTFRFVEQELDCMLVVAAPAFATREIVVTDRSNRAHLRGEPLAMELCFEARRPYSGPEIALVRVRVSYYEPIATESNQTIEIQSIAEIFQPCKESRYRHVSRMNTNLNELTDAGFTDMICTLIENGFTTIVADGTRNTHE